MALLYWPAVEFMKRVFTTSTGDATMVVQKPAPKAAVKWQGKLSAGGHKFACTKMRNFLLKFFKNLYEVSQDHLPVMRLYFSISSLMMS